jgi:rod shape-determining protein MreC
MESFLNRYRNLTVLLVVVAAQLLLLAWQVKTTQDVRLLRVWSVSTVTPVTGALEFIRRNTFGVVGDYFALLGVREENRRLHQELGNLKMQNHFLNAELSTADRVRSLAAFQAQSPSKTIAARIIMSGTAPNSAEVFVDRGTSQGVEKGMAVVTPDGIVGKVVEAYPMASLVLLATDPSFAAGVVSQKNRVHGELRGMGHGNCKITEIQNEQKVDVGEWFYTSGYDRIFPRGFPVGQAAVVRNGNDGKEIFISPSGFQGGLDEVLIVIEGVHQLIPEQAVPSTDIHMMPPPPPDQPTADGPAADMTQEGGTDADRLKSAYKRIGDAQGHVYGEGAAPNFNAKVTGNPPPPAALKSAEPAKPEPADADGGEVHLDQPNYETQEETGATTAPVKTRPQQTKAKSTKPAQTTGGAPRETQ